MNCGKCGAKMFSQFNERDGTPVCYLCSWHGKTPEDGQEAEVKYDADELLTAYRRLQAKMRKEDAAEEAEPVNTAEIVAEEANPSPTYYDTETRLIAYRGK